LFQSKKFGLLMAYFACWLLGTTILSTFPTPVQAGYTPSFAQTVPNQTGVIAGTLNEGAKAVSLTSWQIGLKESRLAGPIKRQQVLQVRSQSDSKAWPGPSGGVPAASLVKPLTLPGFPSLGFSFPGNTVTPDDLNKLPLQPVPPDTMGAAGPSQCVMAINGMLRVFTKASGVPEQPFGTTDPDLNTFFAGVMTPPLNAGDVNYTTFPRVRYDRFSSHWFIMVSDVPGGLATRPNRILLAVSDGPVITSDTIWNFFNFQPTAIIPDPYKATYQNTYADNPTLGIDANALYIGVNLYTTTGNPTLANTAAFVVRKSSVLGSGPIVIAGFPPLIGTEGPFTPQGVDNLDSSVSDGYFIGVNISGGQNANSLQLRKVINPGTNPSISANIPVTVPLIQPPLPVPHKGATSDPFTPNKSLLNPVDNRLMNAVIQNGRLWTTHNVAVDGNGNNTSVDRDGARWYEINLPTAEASTPSLRQSGTIFDSSPSRKFYWMPSLTVSDQGNTVIGFNMAGANDYISAAFTGRAESDSLNTMRPPVIYQTSVVAYNPENNPGNDLSGRPWGDYSFTSLDPEDNMTFWTIQEYAYNSDADANGVMDGYGIQIARIKAPPPATLVSANPSFIISGQHNVDITITGSSAEGSGFYEPGIDFPKHLAASLGGGITVNSLTYLGPTTININVSAAGVTPGHYDLNITNPDGQTVTAANLLNVTCSLPVTDSAVDGATGSLRDVITILATSSDCTTASLENVTHPITLNSPLEIPPGININTLKSCTDGKVEITGNGFEGDGLILNGGTFYGLYVHGFTGRQIAANGHAGSNSATGPNKLNCSKVGTS
jgi:hypothetical protein